MTLDLKTCYWEAGNTARDHVPCDPNAAVSACCWPGSTCIENLYCRDPKGNSVAGTCTAQQWGVSREPIPGCPCHRFIKSDNITQNYRDGTTFCPDGSVCCGIDNFDCCDKGQGNPRISYGNQQVIPLLNLTASLSAYYAAVKPTTLPVSSGTASIDGAGSTYTPTRLATNAATAGASSNSVGQTSGAMSSAVKVGLGVSIGIIGIFMIVAIVFFVIFRKKYNKLKQAPSTVYRETPPDWTTILPARYEAPVETVQIVHPVLQKKKKGELDLNPIELAAPPYKRIK